MKKRSRMIYLEELFRRLMTRAARTTGKVKLRYECQCPCVCVTPWVSTRRQPTEDETCVGGLGGEGGDDPGCERSAVRVQSTSASAAFTGSLYVDAVRHDRESLKESCCTTCGASSSLLDCIWSNLSLRHVYQLIQTSVLPA